MNVGRQESYDTMQGQRRRADPLTLFAVTPKRNPGRRKRRRRWQETYNPVSAPLPARFYLFRYPKTQVLAAGKRRQAIRPALAFFSTPWTNLNGACESVNRNRQSRSSLNEKPSATQSHFFTCPASAPMRHNWLNCEGRVLIGAELGPVNYRPQFLVALDITRAGAGSTPAPIVTPLRRSFLNFLQDVTAHPPSDVTPGAIHRRAHECRVGSCERGSLGQHSEFAAIALSSQIDQRGPAIHECPRRRQGLARGTVVDVGSRIISKVTAREGAV